MHFERVNLAVCRAFESKKLEKTTEENLKKLNKSASSAKVPLSFEDARRLYRSSRSKM